TTVACILRAQSPRSALATDRRLPNDEFTEVLRCAVPRDVAVFGTPDPARSTDHGPRQPRDAVGLHGRTARSAQTGIAAPAAGLHGLPPGRAATGAIVHQSH